MTQENKETIKTFAIVITLIVFLIAGAGLIDDHGHKVTEFKDSIKGKVTQTTARYNKVMKIIDDVELD